MPQSLAELFEGLEELRADYDALVACLERCGLPGSRHVRCERAARSGFCLEHVLGHRGPASQILAGAGQLGWAASRRASSASLRGADAVSEVRLYAVGGFHSMFDRRSTSSLEAYDKFFEQAKLASTEVLDIRGGRWQPSVKTPYKVSLHATAVLGGFMYIFGGVPPVSRIAIRFSPVRGQWSQMAAIPFEHAAGKAVAGRKCIYVFGGTEFETTGTLQVHGAVNCFHPGAQAADKGTWTRLPDMPTVRRSFGAAAFHHQIVLCGGCDTESGKEHLLGATVASSVVAFSQASASWETWPSMLQQRADPEVCHSRGKLYACGGSVPLSGQVHTSIEVFEPPVGQWSVFRHMRVPRKVFAAAVCQGRLYIMGGFRQLAPEQAWDSVECVDLASGEGWELESMAARRGGLSCGVLSVGPSGRITGDSA